MRAKGITRRDFLKSSALVGAAAIARVSLAETASQNTTRLLSGWEYHHGSLGGPWEIWKGQSAGDHASWQVVSLPHCFNARDAVDPGEHYYQGPGWYRTRLKISNPFPNGRTLLYFEGAGQKTAVFVGLDKIGDHIGGYDEFVIDITDAAARMLKNPDAKGELQLWSQKNPNLYRCEVTLTTADGEMKVSERFGLRYTEWVTHGPFKINGERLLIRGTQRHEDHAGLGSAMTEELIRKEMQMIKDVGANFIRLAHYQQSRIVLDLCDELGILVWEEIPWCRSGIGGEQFHRQTYQMLRNMIDQHYNHPAVLIWGLGNEDDWPGEYPELDQQKIRTFLTELRDMAHSLDPTRVTGIRRCDFCKDIPDVYSPSIWAGWYRGRYTEYKSSSEEEVKKVNHFIHMEWGGDSHARRHSEDPDKVLSKIATGQGTDERGLDYLLTGGQDRASRDGDWSETYICNLFDWHLKEQETMP